MLSARNGTSASPGATRMAIDHGRGRQLARVTEFNELALNEVHVRDQLAPSCHSEHGQRGPSLLPTHIILLVSRAAHLRRTPRSLRGSPLLVDHKPAGSKQTTRASQQKQVSDPLSFSALLVQGPLYLVVTDTTRSTTQGHRHFFVTAGVSTTSDERLST